MKYNDNIKKTWEITKDIFGKTKMINNKLPEKLIVNEKNILGKKERTNEVNNFF